MFLRLPALLSLAAGLIVFGAACSSGVTVREEPSTPGSQSNSLPAIDTADDGQDTTASLDGVAPLLDVSDLVEQVQPSVVRIDSRSGNGVFSSGGGVGTGFIVDEDGLILTNNHVVSLSNLEISSNIIVTLHDGSDYEAQVVGRDLSTDIALLQIDATDLDALPLGTLDDTEVGDPVVAFGYALDLERGENGGFTVTSGIVSAKNREIREEQASILGSVQTDAAINPGNSGGPLVNLRGEVVGINTAIATDPVAGGIANGIGFAVGIDTARAVYEEIRDTGAVDRGLLGIRDFESVRPAMARELGIPDEGGILIGTVDAGSPVGDAGMEAGDVLVSIDGNAIATEADLIVALIEADAGDVVEIDYYRDGELETADVTLGEF